MWQMYTFAFINFRLDVIVFNTLLNATRILGCGAYNSNLLYPDFHNYCTYNPHVTCQVY